ncbi:MULTISPECIES: hypothetical protein [unclassified Pseudomonas]|uniref:hypothetical protein n=1 Tax=unclassified Pseudomonas TaxID=196821 RepID=UPI00384AD27F
MTDPAAKDIRAEDGSDPASDFVQSMISALPGSSPVGRSREAQRQWYESLSEEEQMMVRDKIRAEIFRIRSEFGRRSNAVSAHPFRLRDHG